MANTLYEDLKSPITLAIVTLWPLNSHHTCIVWWCKCGENLTQIRQKLLKLFSKVVKMLTEWRNDGITESQTDWKQYTPLKLRFAGGITNLNLKWCVEIMSRSFQPRQEKTGFYLCKTKGTDQLYSRCTADQLLCFRYKDNTINPKFQASSHLLCLYSSVCIGPVRKPHGWFSQDAAQKCLCTPPSL